MHCATLLNRVKRKMRVGGQAGWAPFNANANAICSVVD